MGRTLTTSVTLPIVGIGVAAFKSAIDFDKAFTQIRSTSTLTGISLDTLKKQTLELSGQTAVAPQELADALYFLASAGLSASQVQETLAASAKASAVGLGLTSDIAKITGQALNAYSASGLKASAVTDTLVEAVKQGTASPDEFASALGRILPVASKAGVSFQNVTASLAALSNIGLDVNEGVTALRGVLLALEAPGSQAAKTLKEVGISADEMRQAIADKGLLGALRLLEQRSHGNIDTLRKIIPNVRALTGAFGLTGQEASKVDAIFRNVEHSTGALGKAFDTTAESASFKFRQSLASLQAAGIQLGNTLIPIFTRDVFPVIQKVIKGFEGLTPAVQKNIVIWGLLAAAVGPASILVGGLLRLVSLPIRVVGSLVQLSGAVAGSIGKMVAWGKATGAAGKTKDAFAKNLTGTLNPALAKSGTQMALFGGAAEGATGSMAGLIALALTPFAAVAAAGISQIITYRREVAGFVRDLQTTGAGLTAVTTKLRGFQAAATARVNLQVPQGLSGQFKTDVEVPNAVRNLGYVKGFADAHNALSRDVQAANEALERQRVILAADAKQLGLTGSSLGQFNSILGRGAGITGDQVAALGQALVALQGYHGELSGLQQEQIRNLVTAGDFAGAMRILRREIALASGSTKAHTHNVALFGDALARGNKLTQLERDSLHALIVQTDKHSAAMTVQQQAALRTFIATGNYRAAADLLQRALGRATDAEKDHKKKTDDSKTALDRAKGAAVDYTGALHGIPLGVKTRFEQIGLGNAIAGAALYRSILASIDRSVTTRFQTSRNAAGAGNVVAAGGILNFADGGVLSGAGGFVTRGPTFLVGEGSGRSRAGVRGQEAVIPFDQRGRSILRDELAAAGGGGATVQVIVQGSLWGATPEQLARVLTPHIDRGLETLRARRH